MAPEGFLFQAEFLSGDEERSLLEEIARQSFADVAMHGVKARRRCVHLGWLYGYDTWRLEPGPPLPEFLLPLRDRVALVLGVTEESLAEALITEYPPGAPIGWHRDAPHFGIVGAVSLLSACRLRFRRRVEGKWETTEVRAEPRSFYALTGEARTLWQHSIPPVASLRYSITFRTLRPKARM